MSIRYVFGLSAILYSAVFLAAVGCDGRPEANPTDNHEHAADEHDHDHGEEHTDKHDHEHEHGHDHEHAEGEHAHPETYAAAVAELETLRAAVEKASAGDDLAKADDDVHEIGHLLEDVGKLAEKEPVSDEAKAKIKSAVEDLLDAFEQIDAKIHSDQGKTYADIADKISAAMAVLKANVHEEK
jgi:hypothetical protein